MGHCLVAPQLRLPLIAVIYSALGTQAISIISMRPMTRKLRKKFEPGRGYSKKDWDDVSDNPPLTAKEIAALRPFAEIHPEMAAAIANKRGRPL